MTWPWSRGRPRPHPSISPSARRLLELVEVLPHMEAEAFPQDAGNTVWWASLSFSAPLVARPSRSTRSRRTHGSRWLVEEEAHRTRRHVDVDPRPGTTLAPRRRRPLARPDARRELRGPLGLPVVTLRLERVRRARLPAGSGVVHRPGRPVGNLARDRWGHVAGHVSDGSDSRRARHTDCVRELRHAGVPPERNLPGISFAVAN